MGWRDGTPGVRIDPRTPKWVRPPDTPAPALRFDITCPSCGADVNLRASGVPNLRETTALLDCSECTLSWQATVRLSSAGSHWKPRVKSA